MKMIVTRKFTLGRKDGSKLECEKGDELTKKDLSTDEAQTLYEKGLIDSRDHDKAKLMFELEMEISKVETELEKAAKEVDAKKEELEKLRRERKEGPKEDAESPEETETTEEGSETETGDTPEEGSGEGEGSED